MVDPPLYATVLSSLVTVGRRADLRSRLFPVGTEFPPFGRGRISQLEWALDCGESVDDRVLLDAARVACTDRHHRWPYALPKRCGPPAPAAAGVRSLIQIAPDGDSLGAAAVLCAQLDRTNRDIAEMLTVSPRTVKGHLYRMYLKLGITARDELADVVGTQADLSNS